RYGIDATIAADGTITGGTAKIIAQMAYQNTDGVYNTIAQPDYVSIPGVADLDFDGRDELFYEYTQSVETCNVNQGGCPAIKRTKVILRRASDGSPSGGKSLVIDTIPYDPTSGSPAPRYSSAPGRFINKNTIDFADVATWVSYVNGATGRYTYSTTKSVIKTDADLSMTKVGCASGDYAAVCAALPDLSPTPSPSPQFLADDDGDGIESFYPRGTSAAGVGIGDFLGNGRQQPLIASGGDAVQKGTLSTGVWQYGSAISTNGSGGTVIADINGDGASDVVRYDPGLGKIRVFLSTGIGFKAYGDAISVSGDRVTFRDFNNDGRADAITFQNDTVRFFSLQPTSVSYSAALFKTASWPSHAVIGDFNGDGLPDMGFKAGNRAGDNDSMYLSAPGPGNPDLLRQITTELGGTVAVEYTPSSTWTNNYL
ncbi:VCBS repeat-containing protein, partial [Mesorhizobium sp. B2-3-5]|uniref:FG-GAP repeat domain-containing protein n=1 Tax=Mesorhizobium sp. B2-3-5 TaxID=2589958 RepID=UPI00112E685C